MGQVEGLPRDILLRPLDETSWASRAKCAERVAALYCKGTLDAVGRSIAEETLRMLAYDGETLVRRLLAECLKQAPNLPRDIALALAGDKSEIAVPFIESSPSLGDRELMAILHDHPGEHRLAIAKRRHVSEPISAALCRCDDGELAIVLLANNGAAFSNGTLHWLLDTRSERAILEAIARRRLLPISVVERLRAALHDHLWGSDYIAAPSRERVAV